jgi:6-phosphogluconate dehydrogenase (decarboxylating)
VRRYGNKLVKVRYREDLDKQSVYTTVEVIITQRDIKPATNQSAVYAAQNKEWVAVQIDFKETQLRATVKALGAKWSIERKVWVMLYQHAVEAGVLNRVIPNLASKIKDVELYS